MAAGAGVLLGLGVQQLPAEIFAQYFSASLPAPTAEPALTGVLTGLIALAGFALPAIVRLRQIPPLRVLRRDLGPPSWGATGLTAAAVLTLGALFAWQAHDLELALWLLLGTGTAVLAFAAAAWLLIAAARGLRGWTRWGWRYGIANLARRPGMSVVQLVAFALGLTVVLLLAVVRVDLLDTWRRNLPADAPNAFLINVQPPEIEPLQAFLAAEGIAPPTFHPMVRARLETVNGRPLRPEDYTDPQAQGFATREWNLSTAATVPASNELIAGRWWDRAPETGLFSVSQDMAETMAWRIGDELRFRVADQILSGQIASLRRVDWDSFQVNFFMLVRPGQLDTSSAGHVASFHLPDARRTLLTTLGQRFPTVTPIDVSALLAQVRVLIDRASLAVEAVFLLTLVAAVTVFMAAFQASRGERLREVALLRSFGASRRQILATVAAEFLALGALAGLLAAGAAAAIGAVLADAVFNLPYTPSWTIWVIGILASMAVIGLLGIALARGVLNRPPLRSLSAE
jgi:putative ABC transport system permease protein